RDIEAFGFPDHHTRPEEVNVAASPGGCAVGIAFKHVNAFRSNIKTAHQIRPQLLCMPFLGASLGAIVAPTVNTMPPKCGEFSKFAMDAIAIKILGHVQLPIEY